MESLRLFTILLASATACAKSCAQLSLPGSNINNNVDTSTNQDTGDNEDTEDSGDTGPIDTGPPALCPQPEVEPNNSRGEAQAVSMEAWICGDIALAADQDVFSTPGPADATWMRVQVRAAEIGSFANLSLAFYDDDEDYSAYGIFQPESTDPMLLVPVPGGLEWFAAVNDQYGAYGDNNHWQMLITEEKAPLEWNAVESEDNNAITNGNPIESGDRVFAVLETAFGADQDWYQITIPDDGLTYAVHLRIEAWNYGSPADMQLELYNPDQERKKLRDAGDYSYDLDATLDYTTSTPGTWYIRAKSGVDAVGALYWYVLEYELEPMAE